jgi:hypothetical protein
MPRFKELSRDDLVAIQHYLRRQAAAGAEVKL